MNITFLTFFSCLCFAAGAQVFEPSVLILDPSNVLVGKGLEKEIALEDKNLSERIPQNVAQIEKWVEESGDRTENVRIMYRKQLEYAPQMTFTHVIPSVAESFLTYKLYQRFKGSLVYAVHESSDISLEKLGELATVNKTQFVIYFPKAEFVQKKGKRKLLLTVRMYDNLKKKVLLDKVFEGDDRNQGFDLTCNDGTLYCTINNAFAAAMQEILPLIAAESPVIQLERQLAQDRKNVLAEYLLRTPDPEIAKILRANDPKLPLSACYQGLMDPSKTKFIAFFALDSESDAYKNMDLSADKNTSVISSGNGYSFERSPGIYLYVIVGLQQNSKWYFKKEEVTYREGEGMKTAEAAYFNSLQKWKFFSENSAEADPAFWDQKFFKKVPDLKQDPMWKKYGETIWKTDEIANRPYIGMYELIADDLRAQEEAARELLSAEIVKNTLRPFLEEQKLKNPKEFKAYSALQTDKFTLIFPFDLKTVLSPVLITSSEGTKQIRYFVTFPGKPEVYEWTYLKPRVYQAADKVYPSDIIDELEKVTTWNFGVDTLNDNHFWNDLLLKQENGAYLYLKRIN